MIKKLTKSQLIPTHASTKRKITDELKHNAGWYEVREGSPVEVQIPDMYICTVATGGFLCVTTILHK